MIITTKLKTAAQMPKPHLSALSKPQSFTLLFPPQVELRLAGEELVAAGRSFWFTWLLDSLPVEI